MKRVLAVSLLIVACAGLTATAFPGGTPTVWGTVISVPDGNHVVIQVVGSTAGDWIVDSQETVRYLGSYVSPGSDTACSTAAPQINYQMTFGRIVYLEFDAILRDPDGVVLAYVYLDGYGLSMVNAMLVAMGIAQATVEEPNTRYSSIFLALEAAAFQLGLGCLPPQ